ncbi:hypothetical protein PANT_10d00054 [Moesziomyces antarcticus T-34]|uniref:SUZ domain-containing protein n=1 Tax=Pseudozyma antarctica (strain T-34) TaxID=1151754 RepID=M9LVX5_PSEA3|nr:hypothetical protein PANT_10d00054 [Moesziomyces antarcticus T-34]
MTQLDPLSQALMAASLHSHPSSDMAASTPSIASNSARSVSFASALRSGQASSPAILSRQATPPQTVAAPPASALASASASPLASSPLDDTILQAMRKRDDRIFFSQYENQMSVFVRDPSRSHLELAPMNAYQRLLVHRCADQFHLDHHLDRATQCITLSRTSLTTHPPVLLSLRARQHVAQRDGIDPVDAAAQSTPPTMLAAAAAPSSGSSTGAATPAAQDSATSSPRVAPTAIPPSAQASAPKAAFKIMRRDPSSSRHSRLRDDASASNSDSERTNTAKARKDMTLEEREASYKAARARIFGDLSSADSTSPTSSSSQLGQSKEDDLAKDASTTSESKQSPASSATSSPVASIAGARPGTRKKVPSSSSSTASQDGSSQRSRASRKAGSHRATDGSNDDLDFCRTLPLPLASPSLMAAGPSQPSPLALPAHTAHGYFGAAQPLHPQHSQSNPNLRSRAPAFYPNGTITPTYTHNGMTAAPDATAPHGLAANHAHDFARHHANHPPPHAQRSWQPPRDATDTEPYPALSGGAAGPNGYNTARQVNGVGAWAQHASAHTNGRNMQASYAQPPALQHGPGMNAYAQGYGHAGSGTHSANSSRTSSQRGGGRAARDDAVSVGSISSTASSRSASFSGVSASASTAHAPAKDASHSSAATKAHPSLPSRPAWIASAKTPDSTHRAT